MIFEYVDNSKNEEKLNRIADECGLGMVGRTPDVIDLDNDIKEGHIRLVYGSELRI